MQRHKGSKLQVLYRAPKLRVPSPQLIGDRELCYRNNHASLFKRYASLVTAFANTGLGRDFLGLPASVSLFLPNGYHQLVGENSRVVEGLATFYSRPVYAPLLYPALWQLDLLAQVGAFGHSDDALEFLLHKLNLRPKPELRRKYEFAYLFDTNTYYPDPHPETVSCDGYVGRDIASPGEALATIRSGSGNVANDNAVEPTIPNMGTSNTNPNWNYIYRGIALFDSSSLPDSVTVDSASTSLWGIAKSNALGGTPTVHVVASTPASNTALATSDYGQLGGTSFGSVTYAAWSTTAYNDFTLNASGISNISLTGVSRFGYRIAWDLNNSFDGTWASLSEVRYGVRLAEFSGTSSDPKLDVTFTTTSTSTTSTSTTTTSTSTSTTTTSTSTTSTSSSTSTTSTSTSTSTTTSSSTSTSTTTTSTSTTSTSTTTTLPLVWSVEEVEAI